MTLLEIHNTFFPKIVSDKSLQERYLFLFYGILNIFFVYINLYSTI